MKKFITSILASVSLIAPNAALAENSYQDHINLFNTLKEVGVTMLINPKIHCNDEGVDGFYQTDVALLVICQDNSSSGGPQVDWTANDLDTLRHEAHHVVQDCALGSISDGRLQRLFDDKEDFVDFVANSSFTEERLSNLVDVLIADGLTEEDVLMEVEAYVVAEDISAKTISDKVREFCF